MKKVLLKNIHGIFLLDKPCNMTSNAALQRVKRLFGAKKAGHTGSLDPLATGMLPICFGEATKFSQFLLESDKYYHVIAQLGIKTTTGDAEGEIVSKRSFENINETTVLQILKQFVGTIQQVPSMYSAIKYCGKPLYELARQGIEVERKARPVNIFHLKLEKFEEGRLFLNVHCSKGTYIRTLVEDIGEQLGCGAHVIGLHRSVVASYHHAPMYTMAFLEERSQQLGSDALTEYLLPVETSVESFLPITISTSTEFYLRMGQTVMVPHASSAQRWVRLYSNDARFLGVGEILEDGRVAPRRLIARGNH